MCPRADSDQPALRRQGRGRTSRFHDCARVFPRRCSVTVPTNPRHMQPRRRHSAIRRQTTTSWGPSVGHFAIAAIVFPRGSRGQDNCINGRNKRGWVSRPRPRLLVPAALREPSVLARLAAMPNSHRYLGWPTPMTHHPVCGNNGLTIGYAINCLSFQGRIA